MLNRRNQEEHFILNARSNQKPVQNISHEGGDMMLARKIGNDMETGQAHHDPDSDDSLWHRPA